MRDLATPPDTPLAGARAFEISPRRDRHTGAREHVERTRRVVCGESGDDALERRNAKRACDTAPDGARVNAVATETDPDAHRAKNRAKMALDARKSRRLTDTRR